jgi:hypothetical protein
LDFIVKKVEIAKDGKNNENHQEIQAGQGNGILLPQTDGAFVHWLKGFFLVEELGALKDHAKKRNVKKE